MFILTLGHAETLCFLPFQSLAVIVIQSIRENNCNIVDRLPITISQVTVTQAPAVVRSDCHLLLRLVAG